MDTARQCAHSQARESGGGAAARAQAVRPRRRDYRRHTKRWRPECPPREAQESVIRHLCCQLL
jgi:hypothetical protein